MADTLNPEEERTLVKLLSQVAPGFLPYDLFIQIARLVSLSIIEVVPLRMHNGKVQVLLVPRDANDVIWPGKVHTPGTVLRPTDSTDLYTVFARIVEDELKGTAVGTPVFVQNEVRKTKRGMEQAQIYWVEVQGEPAVGEFYDHDALPENLIPEQRDFTGACVTSFQKEKTNER